jgi:succinoglycan biosynthesis transport protein ExoP
MPEELRFIPRSARVPSPTLRDVLAVVFRQRRLALISFAAVFLAVLLYGVLGPSYQSEMKVLVRRGRVDPVVTPTPSQAEFEREGVTEEELNSEVELLHDGEILLTVVRNSGLISEGRSWFWSLFGDSQERQLARAVRRLDKRLTVEPVRKATLITVKYKSSDPAQAAKVLHSLAGAYLERHEQLHRPSGEFKFFDEQVFRSRLSLEEAELQLMEFGRDQGVTSAALERDMTLQKLSEADAEARQTQVSIAATTERVRALEKRLVSLPERITTQVRDSDNPQLLEKMKARLLELQLSRTELLAKYEPSYRPVQELDEEISETAATIAAEKQSPIRERTSDQGPDHEWAQSELLKAQVELNALGAHATAENNLSAHYREAASQLGDHAIQQEQLLHDLKATEEKYLLYLNKREEARIGDALDQGGILNVTIAEQATVPELPELSALSFGVIGLVCASTLSITLAFVNDHLNPAFRTPDEIVAYLGSPVLASLPVGTLRKMPEQS